MLLAAALTLAGSLASAKKAAYIAAEQVKTELDELAPRQ